MQCLHSDLNNLLYSVQRSLQHALDTALSRNFQLSIHGIAANLHLYECVYNGLFDRGYDSLDDDGTYANLDN